MRLSLPFTLAAVMLPLIVGGCGHHVMSMSNTKRLVRETDWDPVIEATKESGKTGGGPESPDKNENRDRSEGDPGFICVEPVTPASTLHDRTASAKVPDTLNLTLGDKESLGVIYNISDVVLLAQTQAFQICMARMAGEIDQTEYMKQLSDIRASTEKLVLAQTAGDVNAVLDRYQKLVEAQAACITANATDPGCAVFGTAATAVLGAMANLPARPGQGTGGGGGSPGSGTQGPGAGTPTPGPKP